MGRSLAVAAVLIVSFALIGRGVQAQEVEVKVSPPAPAVGDHQHTHDITPDALASGKTEYRLGSAPDDTHTVNLNPGQVSDIIGGTTIIVDTEADAAAGMPAHRHRLSITSKVERQESSGW